MFFLHFSMFRFQRKKLAIDLQKLEKQRDHLLRKCKVDTVSEIMYYSMTLSILLDSSFWFDTFNLGKSIVHI